MSNKIKKYLRENLDIIVGGSIFLAIFLIATLALPIILNTSIPIAYISSGSMEPTYYTGDLVIIKGVKGEEINVGDVIVFQPIGYKDLILHRVAAKKVVNGKYYFLTKGDNPKTNKYVDSWGWVPEDRVKGKVILRIPLVGYIFMFFSTLVGKLVTILIILALLLVDFREAEEYRSSISKNYINSKLNKKIKIIVTILLILIPITAVALTHYIYIGNKTPDVIIEDVGVPIEAFSYKIYPLFIEVKSYGLTSGYVKKLVVTPIRILDNKNASSVIWKIPYPYIGSKKICLDIFLDINDTIRDYVIVVIYYVEKIGGKKLIFEKNYTTLGNF